MLRFMDARTVFSPKTEHFHRGVRSYGAPSSSCSSRDSAEPRRAAAPPPAPSACALSIPDAQSKFLKGALRID